MGVGRKCLPFWKPSLWRLSQSITSLTMNTAGVVALAEICNVMAQLPNLDDLSLSGTLVPAEKGALPGIGKTLGGRFSGKLTLRAAGYTDADIMNMLLGIPTGLRFTEIDIRCLCQCFPSAVKLVAACGKTLVKLSHAVVLNCKSHPFSCSGWLSERSINTHYPGKY